MSDTEQQLATLTERRDNLLLQEEIAWREEQLRHHDMAKSTITEAWGDYIDFAEPFQSEPDFTGQRGQRLSRADDRRNGDNAPIFNNEQTLALIRGAGEWISQTDSTAMGALEALTSYVIHTGFIWTVKASDPKNEEAAQIAKSVQAVIDEFLVRERWRGSLDRELFKRCRRAGERFVRIHKADGWLSYLEVYEPGWITEPRNPREIEAHYGLPVGLDWKYGIATLFGRPDIVVGYWAFRFGDPDQGEFIPVEEMSHAKVNVDRNVKRGLSDFYVNNEWLMSAAKLLRNALQGGTIQASIALLRTWKDGTKPAAIRSAVDGAVEFQSKLPALLGSSGSRNIPTERWYPGKIVDHKGGDLKPGPMGSSNAPQFVNLVQAGLRKAGNSHNFPEFMYSGDASNANYSSTLVSEAPFVKHCESLQMEEDTEQAEILWRVVRNASEAGRFGEVSVAELQRVLDITAEHPDIATRDRDKEHRIRSEEHKSGILSRQTWAEEVGRDYEEEQRRIAKEPPVEQQTMFGALPQTPGQTPAVAAIESVRAEAESRKRALDRVHSDEDARELLEAMA